MTCHTQYTIGMLCEDCNQYIILIPKRHENHIQIVLFSHNKTKQILTHRACKITAIQRIQTTKLTHTFNITP